MRYLYLNEIPTFEIWETKTDDLYIDLGSVQMYYNPELSKFYQYQDWPTPKEIKAMQDELKDIKEDDKQKAIDDMMETIRSKSKKVVYQVIVGTRNLSDIIKDIVWGNKVTKEYLD